MTIDVKKKVFLMWALLSAMVQGALADDISYVERGWDGEKVYSKTLTHDCEDLAPQQYASNTIVLGDSNGSRWYYVSRNTTLPEIVKIVGTVHLIIPDGVTLTVDERIIVQKSDNAVLYIYSQQGDAGSLCADAGDWTKAGIGTSNKVETGEIYIFGGMVEGIGNNSGMGIGGLGCKIVIYGGQVKGTGGSEGIGIGGENANITIYGGDVQATGKKDSPGIGCYGADATLDIFGGTVKGQGGNHGAGIGGGMHVGCGTIHIYDGTITATGGKYGAGIGAGYDGPVYDYSCNIYIHGGKTVAVGGSYGAGIGSGQSFGYIKNVHITIDGTAVVEATGGTDAAGIGYGEDWHGDGGESSTLKIGGTANVRAVGVSYGAGIGGGEDMPGIDVTIEGTPTVVAIAGDDCKARNAWSGSAIGAGDISATSYVGTDSKEDLCHSIVIPDYMMVTAGDSEANPERTFTLPERIDACRWRNYARIEPCQHADKTYTVEEDEYHAWHCKFCTQGGREKHTFTDGACVCGATGHDDVAYTVRTHTVQSQNSAAYDAATYRQVMEGKTFILPAAQTDGLVFMGWSADVVSPTVTNSFLMKDGEQPLAAGTELTVDAEKDLYARYVYKAKNLQWTWSDDYTEATLKCSLGGVIRTLNATVTHSVLDATDTQDRSEVYTATVRYQLNGYTYVFEAKEEFPIIDNLQIADNGDNDDLLQERKGHQAGSVTLKGRTLYKDGAWNTLCLPFDTDIAGTILDGDGVQLKTLESTTHDTEQKKLMLNFTEGSLTHIEAGKPYIIKWTSGQDITDPTFHDVTVNPAYADIHAEHVYFLGNYSKVSIYGGDKTMLYLGADNRLYYPQDDLDIYACRGLFQLVSFTVDDFTPSANSFVLNFSDGEATAITDIDHVPSAAEGAVEGWFTLDGQRLGAQPTRKGVFIHSGRKVVVK